MGGTTRRGFLRLAGSTAAFHALSQLRVAPAAARALADEPGERFFDPTETEILTQLMERIVDSGDERMPRVRDTRAVQTVDALCRELDPAVSGLLPVAMQLFEWGPLFFELSFQRFTRMSDVEKDASLRAWLESRLELRRTAFYGVRNLCFVGYYSQEETWPAIGYQGPLLARGRAP